MREENISQVREREYLWRSSFLSLGFTAAIGAHAISEEAAGFSPLWFPQGQFFVSLVSCVLLVCMLFSQLKILRS